MAVFIDTGVFVGAMNRSDSNHTRAKELLGSALNGNYGRILTSDYIVDEAVTLALVRTHDAQMAVNVGKLIMDSPRIEKLVVTEDDFNETWVKFQKIGKRFVSFTDCSSLVLIEKHGMSRIMSFDSHFDGLIERVY